MNERSSIEATVRLKEGRESCLLRRHPWVFSGALERVEGSPRPGGTVKVMSADGRWLALGAYSPRSQLRIRIWTFQEGEEISKDFFRRRIEHAARARARLFSDDQTTACRVVNAESDGLAGLLVDRYDRLLVCQFLAAGTELFRDEIVDSLVEVFPGYDIFERSDAAVRVKEGLSSRSGVLRGEKPSSLLEIKESGVRFLVDVLNGQKTGFYLDQRENRPLVGTYSEKAEVLNVFSYTGGFGVWALHHGAGRVLHIDTSTGSLELAVRNSKLNGQDTCRVETMAADAFDALRRLRDGSRRFDLIILDPPKFVDSTRNLKKGSRGYKDVNLLAFKLLKPFGTLLTFSCSGHVDLALFQKIVADAALDAGRDARIIGILGQSSDHPVSLGFPEGRYLKGLICTAI